jgi:twitching motility two-component system response regulator PilH
MKTDRRRKRRVESQEYIAEQAAAYGISLPKELSASERYLSPNDIGKILGITGEAVKQWIYHRRLPAVKLANGYWKVRVSDFEAFLKARHDIGRRRILLVDTPEGAMTDVGRIIEKLGHSAITAHNHADALLKALDLHPALVVLDCSAKDGEQWKLAERIRATKALKSVPLLLLASGELSDADQERALQLEAQGFLRRPVVAETLGQEIQRILSRTI